MSASLALSSVRWRDSSGVATEPAEKSVASKG